MDGVAQIQRLGWDWRSDGLGMGLGPGVLLSVVVNGQTMRAFVPLSHVWLAFDQELQKVGCVGSMWVGEPFSVGGFFSFVKKAVRGIGKVAKAVVPKAIQKAASSVINTAKHYGSAVLHAVNKIPILGTITGAATSLALLPTVAASQLVQGKRIDRIAIGQFKSALGSVKTLAPYVQTVISFVPGVGQGLSAGIGGALALASGQSINDALIAAAKAALPGGPIAAAAFSIASDAMQGKPISSIAIDALPGVSAQAKSALIQGLGAAKALASGQPVSQVLIDNALHQLPAAAQKAVQIGAALGHAKNLQQAAGAAVQGAAQLATTAAHGSAAAAQFVRGVRTPQVMNALTTAAHSQQALSQIVRQAQAGHPQAAHIVNALQMFRGAPPAPPHLSAMAVRAAQQAHRFA